MNGSESCHPKNGKDIKLNVLSWYLPVATMGLSNWNAKGEIINLPLSRIDLKMGFIRLRPEDTKTWARESIPSILN